MVYFFSMRPHQKLNQKAVRQEKQQKDRKSVVTVKVKAVEGKKRKSVE